MNPQIHIITEDSETWQFSNWFEPEAFFDWQAAQKRMKELNDRRPANCPYIFVIDSATIQDHARCPR